MNGAAKILSAPNSVGSVARLNHASRTRVALGALTIFILVFLVYRPILPGSFVLDDRKVVAQDNSLVNGEFSPLSIWFRTDFTLSTFAFWLEWRAWGNSAGYYHAVNMLLHSLSAVLVWRLLKGLKIPGAWVAGALFAVHPVCVNSVARISELKNTLSLPFFLLSFWWYLRYEETGRSARSRATLNEEHSASSSTCTAPTGTTAPAAFVAGWHSLSLVAFVLALLSKTSTVMLPMTLLACAAWQRGRITKKDLLHISPFLLLSMAFGLMSTWFQKHQALAGKVLPTESVCERLAVAGRIFWFYLGKALLPLRLNLVYPRWTVDVRSPVSYLPLLLLVAAFYLCWRFRRTWGRAGLFGLGCFAIALFPVLGLFDAQFLTMWQVSDHLQYLPLIAPVALVAACLGAHLRGTAFTGTAMGLLTVLSVLTFQRAQVFSSEEGVLRDTLAKNPAAWTAHNDLGVLMAKRNDYAAAAKQFAAALQSHPDDADVRSNLGESLAAQSKVAEAEQEFAVALKLKPSDAETHKRYANLLARQGRNREAILHLQAALRLKADAATRLELAEVLYKTGDVGGAVTQLREVVKLEPDQPGPLNNLAWLLATCADDHVRDGAEAVRCAEKACQLTGYRQAGMLSTLAAAYAETGRFPEAVSTAETALRMQTEAGDTRSASINRQLLAFYRAGKAWREKAANSTGPKTDR